MGKKLKLNPIHKKEKNLEDLQEIVEKHAKVIELLEQPQRISIPTKNGNTISVFYNPENNLLVVDLVDKNDKGGIELLRKTLEEKRLLNHCK